MRLHEKIAHIRKNVKKLSKKKLHRKLVTIFGDKAISYKSLIRLEKGQHSGRLRSIHQVACGLDMDVKELLAGTERDKPQERSFLAEIIRKNSRPGRFTYSGKAFLDILNGENSAFMATELTLFPGGTTRKEEAAEGSEILVFVTKGTMLAVIYTETHTLRKGDSISFKGELPHHFENPGKNKAAGVIVRYPRSF